METAAPPRWGHPAGAARCTRRLSGCIPVRWTFEAGRSLPPARSRSTRGHAADAGTFAPTPQSGVGSRHVPCRARSSVARRPGPPKRSGRCRVPATSLPGVRSSRPRRPPAGSPRRVSCVGEWARALRLARTRLPTVPSTIASSRALEVRALADHDGVHVGEPAGLPREGVGVARGAAPHGGRELHAVPRLGMGRGAAWRGRQPACRA